MNCAAAASTGWQWESSYERVLALLGHKRGLDFRAYRRSTIGRRVSSCMALSGCRSVGQYLELLARDERQVDRLAEHLTIKISRFFRNAAVFDRMQQLLQEMAAAGRELRLWSAGCGRGEEAYSLAVLLWRLSTQPRRLGSVLGSDLDARALEEADRARYLPKALAEVPHDLLARSFLVDADTGHATPVRAVQRLVRFARHDLLSGEPPEVARFDLISCRNVLIYFDRTHVEGVQRMLARSLRPGGILCLGESEYVTAAVMPLLEVIDGRARLFRRRPCSEEGS